VGFHAAFGVAQQSAAKAAGFVVRMGSKTEEPKHLFSRYPCLIWWSFLCIMPGRFTPHAGSRKELP
jgi:hypothetical protein